MFKIAYYLGCSGQGTSLEYDSSTRAVCKALDVELVDIPDWSCCGSSPAHTVNHVLSAALSARNLAQVGMLTVVILMPMLLLPGAWTPPEAMPDWMRILAYISPLHYFLDAAYGILLKGAGMDLLWDSVLAMATLGVCVFALGMGRFGRQFG